MRFQRLILAAFFPLLCVASHAQSQFDGDFWIQKTTKDAKILYVVGFVDGRNHGINDAVEALGTKIDDPRISKLASEVTVGQIVDGVDEFYKDWRRTSFSGMQWNTCWTRRRGRMIPRCCFTCARQIRSRRSETLP